MTDPRQADRITDAEAAERFIRINDQFLALVIGMHERIVLEDVTIQEGKILSWSIRQASSRKGRAS